MEIFEAGLDDELSYVHYPAHRVRISSTNPIERWDLEIRRRPRGVPSTGDPSDAMAIRPMDWINGRRWQHSLVV
jgi:hypothetical protein